MPTIKEALALLRDYYTNPLSYIHGAFDIERNGRVTGYKQPLFDVLTEANWHLLGDGKYSTAWCIGSDRVVLKINSNSYDSSYKLYAEFCKRHPDNPYLPRIYYSTEINNVPVYVIERLEPSSLGGHAYYNDTLDDMCRLHRAFSNLRHYSSKFDFSMEDKYLEQIVRECPVEMDDVCSRNVMLRGGQIVLTDPAS